jgi:hypothetical protein
MPAMTMREDQRAHRKVCGTFHVRERDKNLGGGRLRTVGLSLSLSLCLCVCLSLPVLKGSGFAPAQFCCTEPF